MEPVVMPVTTPDDVTLYDGNTMTAADWRRMVEPVTGYTEIGDTDLGHRRVRAIKHKGANKWVVTVDTETSSWAYLIQPLLSETSGDDGNDTKHPVSMYWATTVAGFGVDARIAPSVPHRHFDLPGSGTGLIAKTGPNTWAVALWHGYILDFRYRGQDQNFYVTSCNADSVVVALRHIRQWFADKEHAVARAGVDRDTWLRLLSDFETRSVFDTAL